MEMARWLEETMVFDVDFHPAKVSKDVDLAMNIRTYPLGNIQKAIENGPFIVSFPIKNSDFP
jgi:hypothetical protein